MSWRTLLESNHGLAGSLASRPELARTVEASFRALEAGNAQFFSARLPQPEWWRLYPHFQSRTVFLDIETTGLSHYYDEVTLVGLYDGQHVKTLLAGHNLHDLAKSLEAYDIVVTFNGTLFDLRFLRAKFPALRLPSIHLDLRYLVKRLGLAGGLKRIERALGIRRPDELRAIDGAMAPVLWSRYLNGDATALRELVSYNVADVVSLRVLIRWACESLAVRMLSKRARKVCRRALQLPRMARVSIEIAPTSSAEMQLNVGGARLFLRRRPAVNTSLTVHWLLAKPQVLPRIVGIDLRASAVRPTGWALLVGDAVETRLLKTDEELIRETMLSRPDLVSIDAPLTLPGGRCCVSDACSCRRLGIVRECERILWKRGVRVYPCLLPSMQRLTQRGMALAEVLRDQGLKVIESYPGAAQDIMRIPRKRASLGELRAGLAAFGLKGAFHNEETTHDELDAVTSAVVGCFYVAGEYEALGNEQEDYLIVPRRNFSVCQS